MLLLMCVQSTCTETGAPGLCRLEGTGMALLWAKDGCCVAPPDPAHSCQGSIRASLHEALMKMGLCIVTAAAHSLTGAVGKCRRHGLLVSCKSHLEESGKDR